MPAASPSLRWLYLAVLGPLVLLAILAWWGTQSQLKAAWTDARAEAERLAPGIARNLVHDFDQQLTEIPTYPNPPVPGPPEKSEDPLSGTDLEALAAIRDDPDAGLSPAGLPRRALAALRIQELDPSHPLSSSLFIDEAPSILTPLALRRIPDDEHATTRWNQAERIRELAAAHPQGDPVWLVDELPTYIRKQDSKLLYYILPTRNFEGLEREHGLPDWVSVRFTAGRELPPATPLASAPVPFGEGLDLHIIARSSILEAPIRRQQKWTLALLATSLLVAGLSLFAIHRTVARERRLAEMKSQFVASVSHELRAPLGSIRLMAEALQQQKVARPAEFHTLIAREGARLTHLIENVLDFARIEDGRKRYRFEECDLTALIRDTLRLMQPLAHDRGVHLAFDLPEVTATLDPAAIQQALVNLLDNAIKFSPAGSPVHLTLSESETRWQLAIRDHGPGIPASEQRRIFERFHRLGNELRRETQGAGIGLSIVKHIAEAHHGSITVTSTPPRGSTFTLTLPATAEI